MCLLLEKVNVKGERALTCWAVCMKLSDTCTPLPAIITRFNRIFSLKVLALELVINFCELLMFRSHRLFNDIEYAIMQAWISCRRAISLFTWFSNLLIYSVQASVVGRNVKQPPKMSRMSFTEYIIIIRKVSDFYSWKPTEI